MGWKLKNALKSFTDAVTFAPRLVAGGTMAGIKSIGGGSGSEGWEQGYGKTSDVQHDWIDAASPYVNQYAPMVAGGALTMMGMPFLGAGVMTGMQGYQDYDQTGEMDWGNLAKNAAINYGTAGIAQGANKFFSSPASTSTGASGFAPAGTTLDTGALLADGASSATGNLVNAAPSALDGFSNAGRMSTARGANTTQSLPQKAAAGVVKEIGGTAIGSAMYPQATAIGGGATEGALADGAGSALGSTSESAYNIFNPGNTTFDQSSYSKMISSIYANAGQQNNDVMDQFRGNGRWDLAGSTDTPYGTQEDQIKSGTAKTVSDATTEFNDRASLDAIKKANPQFYNDNVDTNYWLNEAKSGYAPKSVMDMFGKYTQYAEPMPDFKSYWAPKAL